jgi:hypothetical protein
MSFCLSLFLPPLHPIFVVASLLQILSFSLCLFLHQSPPLHFSFLLYAFLPFSFSLPPFSLLQSVTLFYSFFFSLHISLFSHLLFFSFSIFFSFFPSFLAFFSLSAFLFFLSFPFHFFLYVCYIIF